MLHIMPQQSSERFFFPTLFKCIFKFLLVLPSCLTDILEKQNTVRINAKISNIFPKKKLDVCNVLISAF